VGKDLVTDLGAAFINQNHQDILTLVQEFNLTLFNRQEHGESLDYPAIKYYLENRSITETELVNNFRQIAAQIGQDADLIDADFDRYAPDFDRLSVTDYLNQHQDKITEPFVRNLIENVIRTEYGVEPEQSSALQLLFILPAVVDDNLELLSTSDET